MRLSTLTLAVSLICASASAFAQDAPPSASTDAPPALHLAPFGSLLTRYELRRGYSLAAPGAEGEDAVRFRTRLGVRAEPVSVAVGMKISARVSAQATGVWNVGGDTLDHPALGLHEGVVGLHWGDVRLDIGRFELAYGDHVVLGTVDWNPAGRTFDAARVHAQLGEGMYVDGFAAWIDDGWQRADVGQVVGEGDVVLAGAYAGFGSVLGAGLDLDVYALSRVTPALRTEAQSRDGTADVTVGARYRDRIGALELRLEPGVQLGGRALSDQTGVRASRAWQANGEVAVFGSDDRLRVGLEGFVASGDDPETADRDEAWAQLYPTAHRWLGHMDVIGGRSNVEGGVLHLTGRPAEGYTVFADVHGFWWAVEPAPNSRYRGAEVDVGASQRLGRGVTLRQEVAAFKPTTQADDDALLWFAELELRVVIPLPE